MRLSRLFGKFFSILMIGVLLSVSVTQIGQAQDMTRVPGLKAAVIDKFGVCRIVRNTGLTAMMIPHKYAAEWALGTKAFLAASRLNAFIEFCPVLTTGDQMPDPNAAPIIGSGTIAVSNIAHPVFQHFQTCFGFGEGVHFLSGTTCVLDGKFWDTFRNEMCKTTPYEISMAMPGFTWAAQGSSCATAGAFQFYERARNSKCRPTLCAADISGSCNFTCS